MPGSRFRAARSGRVALAAVAMTAVAAVLLTGTSPARTRAATTTAGKVAAPRAADLAAAVPAVAHRRPRPPRLRPLQGVLDYLRSRQGVAQVALFDKATGRTYLVADGPDQQYTASIVKVDILAQWLRTYQRKPGIIPANIPFSIRYLLTNMITMSDNSAATGLFYFRGGCNALTRFNTLIPTLNTTVGCETPTYYGWGNTTTTAADQTAIVRTLAYPNRVLTPAARAYGLQLMESVIPQQRWGITCGPWGTTCDAPDYANPVPGVTVALKNGWKFVPTCAAQDDSCPWQVNSIGWVSGQGRDYALAVLTTNNPPGPGLFGFNYGIATIQGVSQLVWTNLAP